MMEAATVCSRGPVGAHLAQEHEPGGQTGHLVRVRARVKVRGSVHPHQPHQREEGQPLPQHIRGLVVHGEVVLVQQAWLRLGLGLANPRERVKVRVS